MRERGAVRRSLVAGAAVLLLAGGGYAAADVYDLVPGVLTRDLPPPLSSEPTPGVTPTLLPLPTAAAGSAVDPLTDVPTPAAATSVSSEGLTTRLGPLLADPALGPRVGVSVRDGVTGEELFGVAQAEPRVPASTAKLLSALAITRNLDLEATMATRVVSPAAGRIVLVAGGDTMLNPGASDPTAVEGRAGLADLAGQVATALAGTGTSKVQLALDLSYAAGPRYPAGWNLADVGAGFTQGVSMVGLAGQRPHPGKPSPEVPERVVAQAFVKLLAAKGITATLTPETTWSAAIAPTSSELGRIESATYADVLGIALSDSDNALTENLVRQAMAAKGEPTSAQGAPAAFVTKALTAAGVDTRGMRLVDTSGLASGQQVSVATISHVLELAATGKETGLREAMTHLPIAGLTGTLATRFGAKGTRVVAGIPRAKTGTLTGSSGMAGTTIDAGGYPLTYVVIADAVPPATGTLAARAALDRIVTALTECGCT